MFDRCCETSLTSDALSCLQDDFLVVERLSKEKLGADVKSLTEATIWTLMMKIICDVHGDEFIPVEERQVIYPLDRSYIEVTRREREREKSMHIRETNFHVATCNIS